MGLVLVAIAPTISVVTGFALKAGALAAVVFVLTKMWMFGLPAFWHIKIEGFQPSYSLPQSGGWKVSTLLGFGMGVVIVIAYLLLGDLLIRGEDLKEILEPFGLTIPWKLALGIFFLSLIHI